MPSSDFLRTPVEGKGHWFARLFKGSDHTLATDAWLHRYIEQLLNEYQLVDHGKNTTAAALVDRIQAKPREQRTWDDAYAIEKALLLLSEEARIRRRAWSIRGEYREVAGERCWDNYVASKPPDADTADIKLLAEDLTLLLGEMAWYYITVPVQDRERNALMRRASFWALGLIVAATAYYFVLRGRTDPASMGDFQYPQLVVVLACGALGGLVSTQQRVQGMPFGTNPSANIFALARTRPIIWINMALGAVFAAILYVLFVAGLLKGGLFPEMVVPVNANPSTSMTLPKLVQDVGPKDGGDVAKVMLWSFIAGFAERFVPDTISRLTKQASEEKKGS